MSESDDTPALPNDAKIASVLKQVVTRIYGSGDHENLTVKRVRKAVEQELDLPESWFKVHATWAEKSKALITSEAERLEAGGESVEAPAVNMAPKANGKATTTVSKKRKKANEPVNGRAGTKPKPRKKRKLSSDEEDEASEEEALSSGYEDESPKRSSKARARPATALNRRRAEREDENDDKPSRRSAGATARSKPKSGRLVIDSDVDEDDDIEVGEAPSGGRTSADEAEGDEEQKASPQQQSSKPQPDGNDSESSLSSLLDEPPKRKRQKKEATSKSAKAKTKTTAKTKSAAKAKNADRTPDDEELTRLKGWLQKCGVRKLWGKELASYETPKAKIAHLKDMLADVGMTGRYSVEKAKQIKEQRELAADLEDVKAFDKTWGSKEDARPTRKGNMAAEMGLDPSLVESGSDDNDDW